MQLKTYSGRECESGHPAKRRPASAGVKGNAWGEAPRQKEKKKKCGARLIVVEEGKPLAMFRKKRAFHAQHGKIFGSKRGGRKG